MSPEWLTAIGTLGTFVVITASAVAALLQLRHMRGSNQIVALTECRETLESEKFQDARRFINMEMPALLADPEKVLRVRNDATIPVEFAKAVNVANFFESMGAFVYFGIVDRKIACSLWSGVVINTWEGLLPVIRLRRKRLPAVWEYFEYLAVISKQFKENNPVTYPRGVPRMNIGEDPADR